MATPAPGVATLNGVRFWYGALSLADLEAMTTATRGSRGEVLHTGDQAYVSGTTVDGGTGWVSSPAIYSCASVGIGSSVWGGVSFVFPGLLGVGANLAVTGSISGASLNITGVATIGGQVNAKLRETKYFRRTNSSTGTRTFQWDGDGDSGSGGSTATRLYTTADGECPRLTIRCSISPGTVTVTFRVNGSVVDTPATQTPGTAAAHFDFTTATWSKGDYIEIRTQMTIAPGTTNGLAVLEWNWSTM